MKRASFILLCVSFLLVSFMTGGEKPPSPKGLQASDAVGIVAPIDPQISKYAVVDVDYDRKDEVAVDFGTAGIWLYDDAAGWTQLAPENPESLMAAELYHYHVILADLGSIGLWMWHSGSWSQMSAANVESMADGRDYRGAGDTSTGLLFADFGVLGFWRWHDRGGPQGWTQFSGANADHVITARFEMNGGDSAFVDFGSLGLWWVWYYPLIELTGANADYITKGMWWVAADFGPLGLWQYQEPGGVPNWTNLTGADADYVIPADVNNDGLDEIVGDFGSLGFWLWDTQWTQLTHANPEYMISADVTGDGGDEVAVDFGSGGLWVWNDGSWSQLTPMDPEYLLAADTNGDGAKEILADLGLSGLWLWNGAWNQISPDNPD